MSQDHEKIVKALREVVIIKLGEKGFKGSFPHFRRPSTERIDLLTFQFDKWGGGFIIEISTCPPDGIMTHWGEHIPPNKVKSLDMHPAQRFRLQPTPGSFTSNWFRYDKYNEAEDVFDRTEREVLPFLEDAEKWWSAGKMNP